MWQQSAHNHSKVTQIAYQKNYKYQWEAEDKQSDFESDFGRQLANLGESVGNWNRLVAY